MALSDLRQSNLIYQLFLLENAHKEDEKKRILQDILTIINKQDVDQIFSELKNYFNLKNDSENKLENQIRDAINHFKMMNSSLKPKDFEGILKILNEQNNSPFKRDVEYTKFLIASEEYQRQTGKQPSHNQVQSVNTPGTATVTPVGTHTTPPPPSQQVPSTQPGGETSKSPVFLDKRNYNNGKVTIFQGIELDDLVNLQKSVVDEINKKNPGSLKFERTEQGCIITGKAFGEYDKILKEKLEQKHQIFQHDSKKEEKDIPEKYHLSSKDHQKESKLTYKA